MKKILGFLVLMLVIIGCTDYILDPDIEVTEIHPLAWYISGVLPYIIVDTIKVVARNSQDSHITGVLYEYYDYQDNLVDAATEPLPLDLAIPGIVEPTCGCTTKIYNILTPATYATTYMINNNLMSLRLDLRFIAQADLFEYRTDTAEISMGLYRVDVIDTLLR